MNGSLIGTLANGTLVVRDGLFDTPWVQLIAPGDLNFLPRSIVAPGAGRHQAAS
jgi:hypothetical protein